MALRPLGLVVDLGRVSLSPVRILRLSEERIEEVTLLRAEKKPTSINDELTLPSAKMCLCLPSHGGTLA